MCWCVQGIWTCRKNDFNPNYEMLWLSLCVWHFHPQWNFSNAQWNFSSGIFTLHSEPFIESKFKDISQEISGQKYLQYLKGEVPGDAIYKNIDYDNVTVQLFEHLNNLTIVGNFSNGEK